MVTYGKTVKDDPDWSPFGPFILDIELSSICYKNCQFCYKSNTLNGKNMSFDTFKIILDKIPRVLTQIAFGIGSLTKPGTEELINPDLYNIMKYCREKSIIPNITINGDGLSDYHAKMLNSLCGAVAVSCYEFDTCFNAVDKLTKLGMKQTNIHMLLSKENYGSCFELMMATNSDKRLEKLNAIVFLWVKSIGNRNNMKSVNFEKYKKLVDYAVDTKINIGFDSCSAPYFMQAVKERENYEILEQLVESCESTLFSYYIDVNGIGYACSFCAGQPGYKGIDVVNCKDFIKDVWNSDETIKFRTKSIISKDNNGCRNCIEFKLI